jgi:tetratricopeptide (TPR) repeat protein
VRYFQKYWIQDERLREALDLFRELNHRNGEATALSNLGQVQTRLGSPQSAIEHLRAALEILRATGHRYGEASALNGLGEALHTTGRTDDALAVHADALAIATHTGDSDEQVRARAAIATIGGSAPPEARPTGVGPPAVGPAG